MSWERQFSNFYMPYKHAIEYDGISYPTVEHFFQAMKTHSRRTRAKIARLPYPGAAKKYGSKVTLRPDWPDIRIDVMRHGLHVKFQYPQLRTILLSTSGHIIHWNKWHDNFWGICECHKCRTEMPHNKLGRLLEQLRDELTAPNANSFYRGTAWYKQHN